MASAKGAENEQQSDETFEFLCSPCKRKDKNTEADKYCADCHDYYCLECVQCHEDIPALSGHKIMDKRESGSTSNFPLAPTERCEQHRFKLVDMYCENHDEVGCCTCMAVDHRACKNIFDIPEFIKDKKPTPTEDQIKADLHNSTELLNEKIAICKKEKEKLLKSKEDALQSLKKFRKEINERLDELEERSRASIAEIYNARTKLIEEELGVLQNSKRGLELSVECFVRSEGNASQRFVCSKKGKQAVESARNTSEKVSTGNTKLDIYFRQEQKLSELMRDMDDIGRMSELNCLYAISKKKQYNVRHQSDKQACDISSACALVDGSIILADRTNKNLKQMNRMYSVVDICYLPVEPWQICVADKETVAVISWAGESIILISTRYNMRKIKEITTDHDCYGIAAAQGKFYVIDPYTSVIIYSMSGTKLNEFSKDQSGQRLFENLYGLAVSDDGMRIYVIDYKYGLVVLNKDGTLQGKYDCAEVPSPRCVCVADNGAVLVSDNFNNCILQFTSDGKKLGNIMASDTENKNCGAVCFDLLKSQLIVGRPGKDEIDIYCVY